MARVERSAAWIVGGALVLLLGAVGWTVLVNWKQNTRVLIGNTAIEAKIARSQSARERGLGGVQSLGAQQGMLFVFSEDNTWGIWMKDMLISIDAIWLDKDKKVVHIVKNISPDSYPELFSPNKKARYILELPAGSAEMHNITIGKQASFELPPH